MSSGSQSAGDDVVPKFDMHFYPSVMTSDKVKNVVAEYAIPLDLHPCVPPSGLTMNRLPVDKIDRRAIPNAMPWRHQDSSMADPPPTDVHAEDIRRLFATSMSQFLKFSMAGGVLVGKGTALAANEVIPHHTTPPLPFGSQIPEKSNHQKVVEVENERVLTAKRKAQAAKDRAVGKRVVAKGASQRTKRNKTTPLSFALSDSWRAMNTNRQWLLEPVNQTGEDTDQPLDNMEDTTKVNSPLSEHSPQFQQSNPFDEDARTLRSSLAHIHASASIGHRVSFTSGVLHHLAFPARHPGGDDARSYPSLANLLNIAYGLSPTWALQRSWFKLGRGALAQIDILQRYEALNEDYEELFESHRSCQDVSYRLTEIKNQLLDTVRSQNQLSEDHKVLQQIGTKREREERIKQLEADLASKTSSLTEAEGVVGTLKGDLERLTVDLSQAEIVRHNYVHHLLPTMVQRLLSSDEYKKSLSDVFNLAIAARWSKGVKAACSEEEAHAVLATAVDYDPVCKETFMSEFDSLFDKSYPYVEKLVESFRLPLGDLQNMWLEGTGPTLSGNAASASNAADA
ncbi:hypothetical protein Tco_1516635 [Tanacetum coccineum]